ncbi:MAG: hypothetical protein GX073_08970 [Firmicutes bacterium]|nr:hypothetical protein [Bacillota bacterium]
MSIFEVLMLVCFGVAWPASIYKSWTSKQTEGKSVLFLYVILLGYISGVLHKLFFAYNWVIYLYMLNGLMVSIDIVLYHRNKRINKEK